MEQRKVKIFPAVMPCMKEKTSCLLNSIGITHPTSTGNSNFPTGTGFLVYGLSFYHIRQKVLDSPSGSTLNKRDLYQNPPSISVYGM